MRIIDDDGAFGTQEFDPGARKVRIAGWQTPSSANDENDAIIHRHHHPHCVGDAGPARLAHRAECHLRVHAYRTSRLEAPQHEIEIVRPLHCGGRELDAATDLIAETARDVAADKHADRPPKLAVVERFL